MLCLSRRFFPAYQKAILSQKDTAKTFYSKNISYKGYRFLNLKKFYHRPVFCSEDTKKDPLQGL